MTDTTELVKRLGARLEAATWPRHGSEECYALEDEVIQALPDNLKTYMQGAPILRSLDAATSLAGKMHHVLSWEVGDTIDGCYAKVVTCKPEDYQSYRLDSNVAAALIAALLKAEG